MSEKRLKGVWSGNKGSYSYDPRNKTSGKKPLTFDALPVAQKGEFRPSKLKRPPRNTPLWGSPGGTWLPYMQYTLRKGFVVSKQTALDLPYSFIFLCSCFKSF